MRIERNIFTVSKLARPPFCIIDSHVTQAVTRFAYNNVKKTVNASAMNSKDPVLSNPNRLATTLF